MNRELKMLETKITQLIALCETLRAKNMDLRQINVRLQQDRDHLKHNMALASGRLDALIAQYKQGHANE